MSKYSDTAYIPFLENLLSCLISGAWYKCTVVFLDANNSNKKRTTSSPGVLSYPYSNLVDLQLKRSSCIYIHYSFIASVWLTLGVYVAKYRANIIHHFIFVFVLYFSYHSSWRSLSLARKSVSENIWAAKSGESSFRSNSPAKSFSSHFRFR